MPGNREGRARTKYRYTLFYCTLLYCSSQVLCFFFFKLKVCGNPTSSKCISAIFPTALAHFVSRCHIMVILAIFQTFSLLLYILRWWLNFLAMKYFFNYMYSFKAWCYCTLKLQYSVNITFLCIGKPKYSCDLLYCDICFIVVVWNKTCNISKGYLSPGISYVTMSICAQITSLSGMNSTKSTHKK